MCLWKALFPTCTPSQSEPLPLYPTAHYCVTVPVVRSKSGAVYSTALYCTVLHCTIPYCTALYLGAPYCPCSCTLHHKLGMELYCTVMSVPLPCAPGHAARTRPCKRRPGRRRSTLTQYCICLIPAPCTCASSYVSPQKASRAKADADMASVEARAQQILTVPLPPGPSQLVCVAAKGVHKLAFSFTVLSVPLPCARWHAARTCPCKRRFGRKRMRTWLQWRSGHSKSCAPCAATARGGGSHLTGRCEALLQERQGHPGEILSL